MGRASSQIVIFLLCLNAVAGLVTASGIGADLDIDPSLGADDKVEQTNQEANDFDPSSGLGSTLFALFVDIGDLFGSIFTLVFYGPVMLSNIGIPIWLTTFPFAPAAFIVAKDIAYALTGRDF